MRSVKGLSEVLFPSSSSSSSSSASRPRYDIILLDQFGVLHDGRKPFIGSQLAIDGIKRAGARAVIVSNSSRRSASCLHSLEAKGFSLSSLPDGAVTSGELTHNAFCQPRSDPFFSSLGNRVLHFTWGARGGGGISLAHKETGLTAVGVEVEKAEMVLMHGTEGVGMPEGEVMNIEKEDIMGLLRRAAKLKLPFICANPDVVTMDGENLRVMPGYFAGLYGRICPTAKLVLMGKPSSSIFHAACRRVMSGEEIMPDRVLVVGDSLLHDIDGAVSCGFDSLFITNGIHNKELEAIEGGGAQIERVNKLCAKVKSGIPTYVAREFVW